MADISPVNPWTCIPSGTLLGVARLFHPEILVEIEATAVV